MTQEKPLRVAEIFGPTIQGEGEVIGVPTVFVRLGGCDDRCTWCDSLHAVDQTYRTNWIPMPSIDIVNKINKLSQNKPLLVSLSGGNPAIQDCAPLIERLQSQGYTTALETQGTLARDWFKELEVLTLSPKPPSSGNVTNLNTVQECIKAAAQKPRISLKFVIKDDADFAYAYEMAQALKVHPNLKTVLQPLNHTPPTGDDDALPTDIDGINTRMRWLVAKVVEHKWYDARVLPQLHVYLWGNQRGV